MRLLCGRFFVADVVTRSRLTCSSFCSAASVPKVDESAVGGDAEVEDAPPRKLGGERIIPGRGMPPPPRPPLRRAMRSFNDMPPELSASDAPLELAR